MSSASEILLSGGDVTPQDLDNNILLKAVTLQSEQLGLNGFICS